MTENFQRLAVEHTVHIAVDRLPEKCLVRLDVVIERREDRTVVVVHLAHIEAMFLAFKVFRHATFVFAVFAYAATERNADQIAFQTVGPLMIGADEVFRVAVVMLAEMHASVGTPIGENIDPAVLVSRHDNWTIARTV